MLITDLEYFQQKANLKTKYYGLDDPNAKFPRPLDWFHSYPVQDFDYQFNSWAFRGPEYEQYMGKPVNVCIGDSFTVNMGGPIEHSWPAQLKKYFDIPTVNLGMDGAGNDAIRLVYNRAQQMFYIQNTFVMYSYFHRRLIDKRFAHFNGGKNTGFIDAPFHTDTENFDYFENNFINDKRCYYLFLPDWCYTDTEIEYITGHDVFNYPDLGREQLSNRDYHHINLELNTNIAEHLYELSNTNS